MTITHIDLYRASHVAGSPTLRIGIHAVFGVAFFALSWGLWRKQQWAFQALPLLAGVYFLFTFLWFANYAQARYDQNRIPFVGVTSALMMGCILWLRPRKLFGDIND